MDGHSGIENRQVNEGRSGNFQLVFSYLKESNGRGNFVIHATSNTSYSYGLQPLEFLQSCGLQHFRGNCQFYHDRCFWRHLAVLQQDDAGFARMDHTQAVHRAFKAFSERIGDLFELRQQQDRILREIGLQTGQLPIFTNPVEITIEPDQVPNWTESVKFPRLKELENQRSSLQSEIADLTGYLPLLYGTGEVLVTAVLKALRFLGLEAEKTKPGFTADILAQTADGSRRFGIEVTGINGPIKKDSGKLTQVLEFERIKEHGEKTILLANTHNAKPIADRMREENFTTQVVDFLSRHPILLMTGWDLYRMVQDVMVGAKTREEIFRLLHETQGVLAYE